MYWGKTIYVLCVCGETALHNNCFEISSKLNNWIKIANHVCTLLENVLLWLNISLCGFKFSIKKIRRKSDIYFWSILFYSSFELFVKKQTCTVDVILVSLCVIISYLFNNFGNLLDSFNCTVCFSICISVSSTLSCYYMLCFSIHYILFYLGDARWCPVQMMLQS